MSLVFTITTCNLQRAKRGLVCSWRLGMLKFEQSNLEKKDELVDALGV